jgi:hypothetical protein
MRKVFVLIGLAGAAAFVAKKFSEQHHDPVWHTPDTDAGADDASGASLDEALADSVEEPHVATTPDAPLQETVLDDES